MVGLNEAYQCLIDPVRRRAYDRRFVAPEPLGILDAVLDAARDRLRHPKWRWRTVGGAGSADAVLEKGDHRVGVRFIGVMGPAEMTDWAKALMAHAGPHRVTAAVCLAYRVVPDLDLPGVDAGRIDRAPPMTVIDLVGSRAAGARIPEPCYHELFEDFLIE
jgi:hypothetical protein